MSKKVVEWKYEFLVDDHKNDSDYTEWTRPYSNLLVFKPYKEINEKLNKIFDKSLSNITYFHNNCNIEVRWQRDKESSWRPLCFCYIIVVWMEENVKKIDKILENEFPWIWEYLEK